MLYIHIDEALARYNATVPAGLKISRLGLGKTIFPEYKDGTINKTLSCWQKGNLNPTPQPDTLAKMAEVLGCTIDFLLGLEQADEDLTVCECGHKVPDKYAVQDEEGASVCMPCHLALLNDSEYRATTNIDRGADIVSILEWGHKEGFVKMYPVDKKLIVKKFKAWKK